MTLKPHQYTAIWLIVSALLLSSLIPGGPIENRDFSHIHSSILGAFNVFLTALDLGSFVLAYFALKQRPWALKTAFYAAMAYFAVYAVDLAQLFPRSPTPMSFYLALIEVLGMSVAIPLMFASRRASASDDAATDSRIVLSSSNRYAVTVGLVVLGIVIVWFATDAAMSGDATSAGASALLSQ